MATINGTSGNDSLTGTDVADSISGFEGNDTLTGLGGIDTLNGGTGNDTYVVGTGDVLSDSGGTDTVHSDVNWELTSAFENLTATGSAAVRLTGNNGANILIGNAADNFFNPRGGNDTIQGGAGNDKINMNGGGVANYGTKVIDGGTGFDTITFEGLATSAITLDLAAGTLVGGDAGTGSATLTGIEAFVADDFNDRLSGSAAAESLSGLAGNDTLSGLGGNDTLAGGLGSDVFIFASAPSATNLDIITDFVSAADKLHFDNAVFTGLGGAGPFGASDERFALGSSATETDDRIIYNTTNGQLLYDEDGLGGTTAQLVATLQGAPALSATDIVVIGQAAPPPPPPDGSIQGTAGDDSLTGTAGDDLIEGLGGNDTLLGLAGEDTLRGGDGSDRLEGGSGSDVLDGGAGDDTYAFVDSSDTLIDAGGIDFINTAEQHFTLPTGFENGALVSDDSPEPLPGGQTLVGNELDNRLGSSGGAGTTLNGLGGNDVLRGDVNGASTLNGGEGNDSLRGDFGDDVLDGGPGIDTMSGDEGDDTYFVTAGDIVFNDSQGHETVISPISWTLTGDPEDTGGLDDLIFRNDGSVATLSGLEGRGNSFDNLLDGRSVDRVRLEGDDGRDTLLGGASADTLVGGNGNDSLSGGAGADIFVYLEGPGAANADAITDFAAGVDKLHLDNSVHLNLGATGNFATADARFARGAGLTTAQDDSDRVIYNTTTGELFYDSDGIGGVGSQLIATLQNRPALNATDIAVSGEGVPLIVGTEGDDTMTGTDSAERIDGRGGADRIDGRGGNDSLNGGPGTDTLWYEDTGSAVVVDMRSGTATGAASGTDTLSSFEQVVGTAFHDHMTADDVGKTLLGGQGNDTVIGAAAGDFLSGDGNDPFGEGVGNGNDEIRAGGGHDLISLNFRLAGGTYGNDIIDGGTGIDGIEFHGVNPLSSISVNLSTGVMTGGGANGAGSATLISIENVRLYGSTSDVIVGDAGANELHGAEGYDTIRGGGGDDFLTTGGANTDPARRAELYGEDGADLVRRGSFFGPESGPLMMSGGAGNDTLEGIQDVARDFFRFAEAPGALNADQVRGFDTGGDKIELDAAAHANIGAGGNFAFGDARFAAGAGFTSGQDADDRVIYDTSTGRLFYDADGSGTGAAQLITTFTNVFAPTIPVIAATDIVVVGQTQPNPTRGTAGNDSLTGTSGNDLLEGLAGNDTLTGLAGDDTLDAGTGGDRLVGGTGNDTYIVDGPGDTVVENAGEGTDTVRSSATRTLDANVENLILTGSSAINGTGNSLNNVITGNSAANVLSGGTGADTLIGGLGNDTYTVDGTGDTVSELAGEGTDTVRTSATRTLDFGAEHLTLTGSSAISGTGNSLNNIITGNGAANTLSGAEGNDTLRGGAGSDSLVGGTGNDRLEGRSGNDTLTGGSNTDHFVFLDAPSSGGVDRITDFAHGTDELLFENGVFTALGSSGAMSSTDGRFRAGSGITTGQDSSDRLIYNTTTDQLYYDADGSGSGGSVLIATFANNPTLTASDFTII